MQRTDQRDPQVIQKRFQIKQNHPHLSESKLNYSAYEVIQKGCK